MMLPVFVEGMLGNSRLREKLPEQGRKEDFEKALASW
jgi:hypothetical protein